MKPLLFNTTLFVLLFTSTLVAQTKTVYQKSFRTHPEEKFELQTINVPVTIETSTDENIHIDFRINFENYSEKEIQEIIDQIEFQSSSQNQFTRFQVFSKTKLSVEHYTLNSQEVMILELDDFKLKSKKIQLYKSRDSILKELHKKSENSLLSKLKVEGKDGKQRSLSMANVQVMKCSFIVKIPKTVHALVNGMDSQVFIPNEMTQRIDVSLNKGLFKAQRIVNKEISLSFDDVNNVQIESLQIKKLSLLNVNKALIGSMEETQCLSKGSRLEIGFVGKGLDIRDFSSKIFLYNFDPKFEQLNLKGEYTELYLFDYGKHIGMKAEGSISLKLQEGSQSSEVKVASVQKQTKDPVFGQVTANLEHGILHVITNK